MMKRFQQILNAGMDAPKKNRQGERGNVLIYILIAVVLFAALGFTVSNMMRGGNADMISEENANLHAGEILDLGRIMRQAVQDMRISNGCEDTQISFTRESGDNYEHASEDVNCQVYSASGGDINYRGINNDALDEADSAKLSYGAPYFSGSNEIMDVGTTCGSADCMELIMFVPFIKDSICRQINVKLGLSSPGDNIPTEDAVAFWVGEEFAGPFGASSINRVIGDDAPELAGRTAACLTQNTVATYPDNFFYQVLITR